MMRKLLRKLGSAIGSKARSDPLRAARENTTTNPIAAVGLAYQIVDDNSIEQGDILLRVPVVRSIGNVQFPLGVDSEVDLDIKEIDAMVLSQTCDLEHGKIDSVVLCELIDWELQEKNWKDTGGKNTADRKRIRKDISQGIRPNYALVPNHASDPKLAWSVVDFGAICIMPKDYLIEFIKANRSARLRLQSPAREHVSQSFGRYFMRVALPEYGKDFESAAF